MPLYEYKCDICGATFEVIQRFSDPPVETCRACGGPVKKVLSAPAIHFKGTGWYVTDYPKKGMTEAGRSSNGKSSSGSAESSKPSSESSSTTPASSSTSSDKKTS
jgi:putative FmdB family regulatory protein